jgi:DNA-directed RNA polymerase subunit M/transcription elongation factor TFIIS
MARNHAKAFPKEPQLNVAGEGKADLAPETAACIFGKEAGTKLGKSPSEEDAGASPLCPSCNSPHVVLNGSRKLSTGEKTQIFMCNDCGRKFSENYIRVRVQNNNCQICVEEAKNLGPVAEIKTVTGDEKDVKGLLLEYHAKMEIQRYKPSTVRLSY